MAPRDNDTVLMEDVSIIFRNFAGREGKFNREGDRNFGVLLPDTVAEAMLADGWNVKYLKPREDAEEDELPKPWIQAKVKFPKPDSRARPPKVMMVTSRGLTNLDENNIQILDWVDIVKVDLIVRPYAWEMNGGSGITAYVKSIYVTIEEDELDLKYNSLPIQSTGAPEPIFDEVDEAAELT